MSGLISNKNARFRQGLVVFITTLVAQNRNQINICVGAREQHNFV